jgi:hypothetical protein
MHQFVQSSSSTEVGEWNEDYSDSKKWRKKTQDSWLAIGDGAMQEASASTGQSPTAFSKEALFSLSLSKDILPTPNILT